MAIVAVYGTTAASLTANVSGNLYVIGPNAIVATAGDAVDGANTTTSKRVIVQGSLIAEQDGIDLGSGGAGGFNQVQIAPGGSIVAEQDGIEAEGGGNVINNEGSIFAVNDGIFLLNDGNTVTNYGTITGVSDGVDITGNSNVLTNYGRITGGDEGVEVAGNLNQLFNFGDIVSTDDFIGNEAVEVSTSSVTGETFSLWNYGKIAGLGAFSGGAGIDLVTNAGAIIGEVRLNQSNDVLNNFGTINGFVDAGAGDDIVVNSGRISEYVQLGGGNDLFDGRGGWVFGEVRGGAGDDTYRVDKTGVSLVENAGEGTDTVESAATFLLPDHIENLVLTGDGDIKGFGNSGDNVITPNSGANRMVGGDGIDLVTYETTGFGVDAGLNGSVGERGALGDVIFNMENLTGTIFGDSLTGSNFGNTILGLDGPDEIFGLNDIDQLHGGDGDDVLDGGNGSDVLNGDGDNDILRGGAGDDQMDGGDGDDVLRDYQGIDTYDGGIGTDTASYEQSIPQANFAGINLAAGTSWGLALGDTFISIENLIGSNGGDTLAGDGEDNRIDGWSGNDRLYGELGDDMLFGGSGNDQLFGQPGNDILAGGRGDDLLNGGTGNDTFVFENTFGDDQIVIFEALNDLEKIDLAAVGAITDFADLAANHMAQVGLDVVITDGPNTITLQNVALGNLDANDFLF